MLSSEKTFPIFSHVNGSANFSPGNFCNMAVVTVSRSEMVALSDIAFGWGEVGFKRSAMVVISVMFLSVTVSNMVLMSAKRAKFQMGTSAYLYALT